MGSGRTGAARSATSASVASMAFVTASKMFVLIYLRVFSRGFICGATPLYPKYQNLFCRLTGASPFIARRAKGNADAAKRLSSALAGSLISRRTGAAEALKSYTGLGRPDHLALTIAGGKRHIVAELLSSDVRCEEGKRHDGSLDGLRLCRDQISRRSSYTAESSPPPSTRRLFERSRLNG